MASRRVECHRGNAVFALTLGKQQQPQTVRLLMTTIAIASDRNVTSDRNMTSQCINLSEEMNFPLTELLTLRLD